MEKNDEDKKNVYKLTCRQWRRGTLREALEKRVMEKNDEDKKNVYKLTCRQPGAEGPSTHGVGYCLICVRPREK